MNFLDNPIRITYTDDLDREFTFTGESDVKININDGKLSIYSPSKKLKNVKLYYKRKKRDNALFYVDCWERAYGSLGWRNGDVQGAWYMIEYADEKAYCMGVKVQPNSLCIWEYYGDDIIFTADIKNGNGGVNLGNRTLIAAELVEGEFTGSPDECAAEFCKVMCETPKRLKEPVYGGNDWYCNYGDNSYEKIVRHAKRIAECAPEGGNLPFMVIDDGWELCHCDNGDEASYFNGGPWRGCNRNFGDMRALADELKEIGVKPGIWYRSLLTTEKLPKEYELRRSGMRVTLDISQQCVLDLVAEDIKRFVDWGYMLIKHDFSTIDIFGKFGFEMLGEAIPTDCNFADKEHTNAEIIKRYYHTIKDAAGEEVLVMGCNTLSHLSAGVFDLQRTSDDTSGRYWSTTRKNGINTLAMRMHQHNIFYSVDADCVGITNDVPWEKNKLWLDVLSKSGTPLFVSIADDAYTDERKEMIKAAFEKAAKNQQTSFAEDILKTNLPTKWKSIYGEDTYDWN